MLTRRRLLHAAAFAPVLAPGYAQAVIAADAPLLGPIRAITITTGDLRGAVDAWRRYMGYSLIDQGQISDLTAASWGAPGMAGRGYAILQPASGEPTVIRFVSQAMPEGYQPDPTLGWRATEITVQNCDELYKRLLDSPFKILRPPHGIPKYPYLRAMQALGPSNERLNLTWITEPREEIPAAASFVGRCFIAVLASPDLKGTLQFYRDVFGNRIGPIEDLPMTPKIELAVIDLADKCEIEADQYPAGAKPRWRPDGGLPAGLAIVTFECPNMDALRRRLIAPPAKTLFEPHRGRLTATMHGYGEELIELTTP